jgi:hydrogenase expression/formation protein HypD
MVYSPLDALRIAKSEPDRQVVFFAIGFETTAPSTALTLKRARAEGVANFSCMCNHVTIVPPLRALLDSPDLRLDGFVGPGHVSTVVGARPFEFIPADYGKPIVVSGFEPVDILQSVLMILRQLRDGRCEVENQYKRVVPYEGNLRALEVMSEVFALRPHFEWRGLGFISQSGLSSRRLRRPRRRAALRRSRRARRRPEGVPVRRGAQGRHQAVGVQGVRHRVHARAADRHLHGVREGACAAYYNYGRFAREREVV